MNDGTPAPAAARDELRRLWILIAINFVDMIGFAIVFPLLPFYALKLNASATMIGVITAAFSMAQILSAPLWGRVSDRYGRRPALLIGLLASAGAFVVFGLATSIWVLLLSRFIQGAGGGTTGVAQAYIADTVAPANRARALGWLSAATSAGVSLGPLIGQFSTHFGPEAPGFIAAALCLVNAIFAWRWLPESRQLGTPAAMAAAAAPRRPVWSTAFRVLAEPSAPASRLIIIYGVGMLAFAALTSVLALYLNAKFGVTAQTIGYFFTYVGLLSVVMRSLLLGPIVARLGEIRAMQTGALVLIVGLLLYPLAPTLVALAIVIPLVPIGTALLFPASTSLLSRAVDRQSLGLMMGVAQTFAGVARVIAPIAATRAFEKIGHGSPFILAAIIVAGVSVLAFKLELPASAAAPAAAAAGEAAPVAPEDVQATPPSTAEARS